MNQSGEVVNSLFLIQAFSQKGGLSEERLGLVKWIVAEHLPPVLTITEGTDSSSYIKVLIAVILLVPILIIYPCPSLVIINF